MLAIFKDSAPARINVLLTTLAAFSAYGPFRLDDEMYEDFKPLSQS